MKKILLIFAVSFTVNLQAQIRQATLQASGLTCAMCSNAINKALQKLPFAAKVEPNIAESSFSVTFKQGAAVDFDVMRKAVEGAGFSVAKLLVKADFNEVKISNDTHVLLQGQNLHFLGVKDQVISGNKTFQVVDKKFVSDKTFKKFAASTSMDCVNTGVMASGSSHDKGAVKRVYHVTI